jgi:hypothetical protein
MRISRDVAERTAKLMTEKKELQLTKMKDIFGEKIRNLKIKTVPEVVMQTFKNHPNYVNKSTYINIYGVGFNNDTVWVKEFPYTGNNSLQITEEMGAKSLLKEFNEIETLKKEIKDLKKEIEVALYNTLKTYNRVSEVFPEAFKHLPKLNKNSSAIVVNLDHLRKQFQQVSN